MDINNVEIISEKQLLTSNDEDKVDIIEHNHNIDQKIDIEINDKDNNTENIEKTDKI